MVKNFLKNGSAILMLRQTNILSAAVIIMVTVAASALLGLVRDRLLAGQFGATRTLDIYLAAFRLPDIIFQLLVMGALSAAFIPVFTEYINKDNEKTAWHIASSIINIGLVIFMALSLPIMIFAELFSKIFAPGFSESEIQLMANLTRIMMIAQTFFIAGNFFTGILQSYQRFLVPAIAPIFYNLGIIVGIVFLAPTKGIYGPTWGVFLGTILFFLIQLPFVKKIGIRHSFVFDYTHKGVREIGRLTIPRVINHTVSQVDLTIDLILASLMAGGQYTIFNFARHLMQFPVNLFGSAIGQASLPTLSAEKAKQNLEEFKETFLTSFHQILYLTVPASVLLLVLRIPAVRLVFGAARYDWPATVETGRTLGLFCISIFAQSIIQLLIRGFYAFHNTKTPLVIGAVFVALNSFLSIFFTLFLHMGVKGLALSTSIAAIGNAIFLLIFLNQLVNGFSLPRLLLPAIKIFLASFITGIFLYVPMKLLDQLVFDTTRTVNLIMLTATVSVSGLSVYLFLTWALKVDEVKTFISLAKRIGKWREILSASPEVIEPTTHESHP
jgi:putative peptidoglycan lipid II flippase